VAGRQGDYYILPILEGSASIARDCKRDIYSRFLHINLHIYSYLQIHSHIVAGRQGDYYILPILEGSASIAHDYKRDIYSKFLHINIHLYIHLYFILNLYLLLHLIIVYIHLPILQF
jgi:uncharacterized protein YcaQ